MYERGILSHRCLLQVRLQSEDYGKHLMGVEDLLQKHSLLESDIKVVGERVKTINGQAEKFVIADFPEAGGMSLEFCFCFRCYLNFPSAQCHHYIRKNNDFCASMVH